MSIDDASTSTGSITGRRVLIVEDEMLLALDMAEQLERLGATPVGPFVSVAEALDHLLGNERLDAALINVDLRGDESFPVADALRKRGIPLVFVTGNDEVVRERYPEVPVHPKPADMLKIVNTLIALIASQPR